jgi:hypothetical protein
MSDTITHNSFEVTAVPASGTMEIAIKKDGVNLGSVEIDTKEASRIAAILLGTATKSYDLSGKPPPTYSKEEGVNLTAIYASGYNVGPGRKSTSKMAIFHFGDTTLGIELPNSDAQSLGKRLMTAAADEASKQ